MDVFAAAALGVMTSVPAALLATAVRVEVLAAAVQEAVVLVGGALA